PPRSPRCSSRSSPTPPATSTPPRARGWTTSPASPWWPRPRGGVDVLDAVRGIRVGHWEGEGTGVTVVLAPSGTVGSGEVRGGAPATREFALLDPERTVARVDAVVLAGGSA